MDGKHAIIQERLNMYHRTCKYRNCDKEFTTDNWLTKYCCADHRIKESNATLNEQRTQARREAKRGMIIPSWALVRGNISKQQIGLWSH